MTGQANVKRPRRLRLTYRLSQSYLEIARSVIDSLDPQRLRAWRRRRGVVRVATLLFAAASLTIIYSYLAVESFINYQLYGLWMRPTTRKEIQRRLRGVQSFTDMKRTKARDLRERVKLVETLLGCRPLHKVKPRLWAEFLELLESSRHFLAHPIPDPIHFQEHMNRIMKETNAGKYVQVAGGVIDHFYDETHVSPPPWLQRNVVIKCTGFTLVSPRRGRAVAV